MTWMTRIAWRRSAITAGVLALVSITASATTAIAQGGKTIDLSSGASIYYETQGSGRPLLVIHGGLGLDHSYFRPWLDPLANSVQMVFPNIRGNGRSAELPDEEYTLDKMIGDLDALRAALGHKEWAVLGHSYGGYLAQLYALKYPEKVSYLVLVSTSPARSKLGNKEGLQLVLSKITPAIREGLGRLGKIGSDEEWRQVWHTILPLYFHEYPAAQFIANDKTIYRHRVFKYAATNESPKFDTRGDLAKLTMPTLVAVGRHDWVIPVRHSQMLYKGIPGAELVIFDRSGHFPFIEEPDKFVRAVKSFLGAEP